MTRAKPNIIYFLVDNLGFGELGCYGGGILRGADTRRIDAFAGQGMKLLNFAPEAQCTPSRSALMTGRYAIRSGNHTVALAGAEGGLVAWERTVADILSAHGYATACMGKWHIGASDGRWPTDHGFDAWYGIEHTWDECLWPEDPWYDPKRDPVSNVLEVRKGEKVRPVKQLTRDVRRDIDAEFLERSRAFMKRSVDAGKPFFLYFNHSLMHMPTIPRREFRGKSGQGEWADCLLELDADFGSLLDYLLELGVEDNTVVIFSGDNGPEEILPWRGTAGFFEGSYFTGMEGSLRTPCLVRYPGRVSAGRQSNEIVHITDMFTTMVRWAGADIPKDRVIDGVDQRAFLEGKQESSSREGFPYWMADTLYGVKWRNFKMVMYLQKTLSDPALKLPTPHVINLLVDPKEREPFDLPYLHSWVGVHIGKILKEFEESVRREPLIPAGAPLDFVPARS
jgi:arylsulfatase